jgi:hypothetical protein
VYELISLLVIDASHRLLQLRSQIAHLNHIHHTFLSLEQYALICSCLFLVLHHGIMPLQAYSLPRIAWPHLKLHLLLESLSLLWLSDQSDQEVRPMQSSWCRST